MSFDEYEEYVPDDDDEWGEDFEADADEGDLETTTSPCPECGADVYLDVDQCPVCGEWIVHSTAPMAGKPAWFVLLGFVGILAVIVVLSGLVAWM